MTDTPDELDGIERWLNDHFRPYSDTWPRMKKLIDGVRELRGWPDPGIRVPTPDGLVALPPVALRRCGKTRTAMIVTLRRCGKTLMAMTADDPIQTACAPVADGILSGLAPEERP